MDDHFSFTDKFGAFHLTKLYIAVLFVFDKPKPVNTRRPYETK